MPPPSTSSNQSSFEMTAPSPPQENPKKTITPTRTNATKKRPITDHYLDEAQKKINESFDTLNHVLKVKKVDEDECDVYAKLLAKKLRKYPDRMRDQIMYKIDGFLLDNPYPDERPSSAYSSYHYSSTPSPHYQNTPSPHYQNNPSPASDVSHVNMPEGNESQPQSLVEFSMPLQRNISQGAMQPTNLIENAYLNAVTKYY